MFPDNGKIGIRNSSEQRTGNVTGNICSRKRKDWYPEFFRNRDRKCDRKYLFPENGRFGIRSSFRNTEAKVSGQQLKTEMEIGWATDADESADGKI